MSKPFLNFLCVVAMGIIFIAALGCFSIGFGFGWVSSWNTWSDKLGLFIFFLSFIPIFHLRKTITLVNAGNTDKRILYRILLAFSWITIPLIYLNSSFYSNLQCFEAQIVQSGALPARCYDESNPYIEPSY